MGTPMQERCAQFRNLLKGMPYASLVPSRDPVLKYHVGLGRAKSAVAWERPSRWNYSTSAFEYRGARGGEIYKRTDNGTWELLYRVEEGTTPEELPWKGI